MSSIWTTLPPNIDTLDTLPQGGGSCADSSQLKASVTFDVAMLILEQIQDITTLIALSSTNQQLRNHGSLLALALCPGALVLASKAAIASFFAFVTHSGRVAIDDSRRLQSVTGLDIAMSTFDLDTLRMLSAMVAKAPKLTELTLRQPEEALKNVSVRHTLKRITTLRALRVFGAGPRAHELFSAIRSPLEEATITPRRDVVRDEDAVDFSKILRRHKYTLVHVSAARSMATAPTTPAKTFFGVRKLHVPLFVHDAHDDFVWAFPDIVELDVGNSSTAWSPRLRDIRKVNKMATKWAREEHDAWWRLEVARGDLFSLYMMGNTCVANALVLVGVVHDRSGCLASVIKDHVPRVLRLSISPFLNVDALRGRREALTSVSYLALRIVLESDIEDACGPVVCSSVHFAQAFENCKAIYVDVAGGKEEAARLEVEHALLAACLFNGRVKDVCIRTPSCATFWRFGLTPGGVRVHGVSFDDGKRFFENLGLFSPEYPL
ncbi:hypothetical protein BD309DRAFT_1012416 [Dichomitus squalens]|nr:hypothetical protein BD309DRAFT_1012416 [Dichomitus squalens]